MLDANAWVAALLEKLERHFREHLLFVGLQGSYRRGEATENSDIDIITVLDRLSIKELKAYRKIVREMPHPEKACGFICGREELANWPRFEIFQLLRETQPCFGTLEALVSKVERSDILNSLQTGASATYHAACHTFLYANQEERSAALRGFYKDAFFLLQVAYYLRTGHYAATKRELLPLLDGNERDILSLGMSWPGDPETLERDTEALYARILIWSSDILTEKFDL